MKKKALLKMIDTYIVQLKEIRKDIDKMVANEDVEEVKTNDEIIDIIARLFKDKTEKEITYIVSEASKQLNDVDILSRTSSSLYNVDCESFEKMLLESGYKVIKYRNTSDNKKNVLQINSGSGRFYVRIYFDTNDKFYDMEFNSNLS